MQALAMRDKLAQQCDPNRETNCRKRAKAKQKTATSRDYRV
jgi:hypothetical protein